MTKQEIQGMVGKRVLLTSSAVNYLGVVAAVRDREDGIPDEVWVDFEDGYAIPSSVPGFALVEQPLPEPEEG